MSAHLPEEASSCAIGLYQQDRALEQMQSQSQQDAINQQRRREGLEIPNNETLDSDSQRDNDGQKGNEAESRADFGMIVPLSGSKIVLKLKKVSICYHR